MSEMSTTYERTVYKIQQAYENLYRDVWSRQLSTDQAAKRNIELATWLFETLFNKRQSEELERQASVSKPAEAEGDVPEWVAVRVGSESAQEPIAYFAHVDQATRWVDKTYPRHESRCSVLPTHILTPAEVAAIRVEAETADLRKQLAERDAEVERLREEAVIWDAQSDGHFADVANATAEIARLKADLAEARKDGATLEGDIRKMAAVIDGLRKELAEARKPVGDVEVNDMTMQRNAVFPGSPIVLRRYVDKWLSRERAARLEAERQRDELREAHRLYRAQLVSGKRWNVYERATDVIVLRDFKADDPNDAVLAAYRASKADAAGGAG